MKEWRDNILRVLTSLDMFASAGLLLAYALTGLKTLMACYYVANLILLLIVVIYFFSLSDKRSRIEKTKAYIRKIEEDGE